MVLSCAGTVGMKLAPLLLFLDNGAVEAIVMFGLFLILCTKWNKSKVPSILIPLLGYSFAW